MNHHEVKEFQTKQGNVVTLLGSFISILKDFSANFDSQEYTNLENDKIRQLQPLIGGFGKNSIPVISSFLSEYHYTSYANPIFNAHTNIGRYVTLQTMPSQKAEYDTFKEIYRKYLNILSEAMISIAQIIPPHIDINIKANNPLQAYSFLKSLFSTISSKLVVVDPYIDKHVFYRYLMDVNKDAEIKVFSDESKLNTNTKNALISVESLFKVEYAHYSRTSRNGLHDRFIITETGAYSLGGSLKDAAKKQDFSITQLSDNKREDLLKIYS